jgi:hexosaminidase
MPWPAHVSPGPGELKIVVGFSAGITGAGSSDPRVKAAVLEAMYHLYRQTGIPVRQQLARVQDGPAVVVTVEHRKPGIQKYGDDESYHLTIAPGSVKLVAPEPLGAIRGLQTFLQLVRIGPDGFTAPAVDIQDQPRFGWRGLSLDVSRHFIPVSGVKRTLDGMAAVKLNVFHWHLSDDQGFRIESKRYPLLQREGSDGQYYTQAEVRDIIAYARERGIRVVPEFDIPGHATSWFVGYPRLATRSGPFEIVRGQGVLTALMDPAKESTYRFLNGFIGEMAHLFPDQYFHIGGDEVDPKEWNESPHVQAFMKLHRLADAHALQAYFNRRVEKIVTKYGKRMEGWDEILSPNLPKNIVIQSWRGQDSLAQAAREGYSGLLSAGYYLDLMYPASQYYAADPLKGATANLTPEQKKLIYGGEAAMWEELATLENIDVKLWPRLAAIAERLWSPEDLTDVHSMYRRLEATDSWLQYQGIQQRSQLRLMQERLAGSHPVEPLTILASVLEPIKGYKRHSARDYSSLTPYNRLVDSIAPESRASREFRDAVGRFVADPKADAADGDLILRDLTLWKNNISQVMPVLESNSLLAENIPVAKAVTDLSAAGLEAFKDIRSGKGADPSWVKGKLAAIDEDAAPKVEMLIQFAPGVRKLVEALQ